MTFEITDHMNHLQVPTLQHHQRLQQIHRSCMRRRGVLCTQLKIRKSLSLKAKRMKIYVKFQEISTLFSPCKQYPQK